MAAATARPMIEALLPQGRTSRLAAQALVVFLGSLVLWVSAKVHVPFYPVPMTLQTLAVPLVAAGLGSRLGVAAVALYLLEGALGLPVFSGTPERGIGLAYMMGPTGGYLVGYVVAAYIVGRFVESRRSPGLITTFGVILVADAAVFALGFAWLALLIGAETAWTAGVLPFLLGDLTKAALAAALTVGAGRARRA